MPWSHLAFYVVTNVVLAAYSVLIIRLVVRKRRSAIVHNAVWAVSTVVLLVAWHLLGMKSLTGVVVDSVPGLVGVVYLARSSRARRTLVR